MMVQEFEYTGVSVLRFLRMPMSSAHRMARLEEVRETGNSPLHQRPLHL